MKRWAQRLLFLAVFGSVGWAPLSVIVFYVLAKLFAEPKSRLAALIDQTETQFFTWLLTYVKQQIQGVDFVYLLLAAAIVVGISFGIVTYYICRWVYQKKLAILRANPGRYAQRQPVIETVGLGD